MRILQSMGQIIHSVVGTIGRLGNHRCEFLAIGIRVEEANSRVVGMWPTDHISGRITDGLRVCPPGQLGWLWSCWKIVVCSATRLRRSARESIKQFFSPPAAY